MTTEVRILEVARSIRSDAWVNCAARGAFSLGFADNRESKAREYNEAATQAAKALKAAGFSVQVRGTRATWPFLIVTVREVVVRP